MKTTKEHRENVRDWCEKASGYPLGYFVTTIVGMIDDIAELEGNPSHEQFVALMKEDDALKDENAKLRDEIARLRAVAWQAMKKKE